MNDPNTSTDPMRAFEALPAPLFPLCFPSPSFIEGDQTSLVGVMKPTISHTLQFGLFLSTPKAKESHVYVRMYPTKLDRWNKGKIGNVRVGVIPNLTVRTRHWVKGGLTPTAPSEQRALIDAVRAKLTSLQAELTAKPRHINAANVRAYLWPAHRDQWGKLFAVAAGMTKPATARRYRFSILSYKRFCRGQQPTAELFSAWVKHIATTKAERTANSYAGAVRSCSDAIGLQVQRHGLRVKEPTEKSGIALTTNELKAFLNLPLEQGSTLARVRDAFIIACLSSLRSVDWCMFSLPNIGREVVNAKTGKPTPLPDLPLVRQLIERNGGTIAIPKDINRPLRLVAERVAITCPSLLAEVEVLGKVVPRWYACTSHCGRRTFVSHGYANKVDLNELMRFTGHGSTAQLERYNASIISHTEQAAKDAAIASRVINLDLDTPSKPKLKVAK